MYDDGGMMNVWVTEIELKAPIWTERKNKIRKSTIHETQEPQLNKHKFAVSSKILPGLFSIFFSFFTFLSFLFPFVRDQI